MDSAKDRLKYIVQQEKILCSDDVLDAIIKVSEGDLRKAITVMQSASRMALGSAMSVDMIYEIAGIVPEKFVEEFLEVSCSQSLSSVAQKAKEITLNGFSAHQFISQVLLLCFIIFIIINITYSFMT